VPRWKRFPYDPHTGKLRPVTAPTTPARVMPRSDLDVLREQIAPSASDEEMIYLDAVAKRFDLDPIAGQVVLIGRYDSRVGRTVHRPSITAEGRLVIAERTGELLGIDGPEWTGPRNRDGSHTWVDVWDDDDPPHAARAFVHRDGRRPANGTVRWIEFAQRDRRGQLMPTWAAMPSHMLGKVAISLGLRRAFPGIIPADLELEDFERDDVPGVAAAPPAGAPSDHTDDAPAVITNEQRERIGALLIAEGRTEAADQLARVGEILGRTLDAPGRLTYDEAADVLDALAEDERPFSDDDAPADDEEPSGP